ncbi:hypothetical protein HZF08_38635 [Paenibacillus sp. CGMCC 1.16610]|uniref:Uncharacterized protein n=1 Tax=Paenibacillus anseongense TaxID=2682845 RepID=A0ABW9UD44_9BACL|nr:MULTISPECIES: hypothetical protein [Paenibacillus]MBA2944197.1 hypothetical protein [Paenibacillus sp. CGMCC 1.16610]MVQ38087.1 hypothetical protein [Paenibacillus anseongense]
MSLVNSSKSQFSFIKKENQDDLAITINNSSKEARTLSLAVRDADTGNRLPATINGEYLADEVQIPPETLRVLLIDVSHAGRQVVVEFTRNSSGSC